MEAVASRWIAESEGRIAELRRLREAGLVPLDGDFLPAVHYPPITRYPPATHEAIWDGYRPPEDGLFDLYLHLPFCETRCVFCHYPVKVGEQRREKERYLRALMREIDLVGARLGAGKIRARSVLVGGGTPSHLPPTLLARFHEDLERRIDLSACTQFNYDVDPATLLGAEGAERVAILRRHGVNRVTIGLQSLSDPILARMNRAHTVADSLAAIDACRAAGFVLNVEFIFGYPGVSLDEWAAQMERAAALDVDEIQLYRLKLIPYGDRRGPITHVYRCRREDFPSPEETLRMKAVAHAILAERGFNERLSRVFCRDKRPEHYSHYAFNQCCALRDGLGFGLTAFSSLRDRFALNTLSFPDYYAAIEAGRLPVSRGLVRGREEQARWSLILPLKNGKLERDLFERRAGGPIEERFGRKIARLIEHGLVVSQEWGYRLTPMGRFFADEVVQQFYTPAFLPCPREGYADGPLNPHRAD